MTFEDDIKLIDVNKLRVTMKTEMTSEPNACMQFKKLVQLDINYFMMHCNLDKLIL